MKSKEKKRNYSVHGLQIKILILFKLSEQFSSVESKWNSLNDVKIDACGWGVYCSALNAGGRWIGGNGGGEAKSNGREQGQSNKRKAILLTLPDCPTYPVHHQWD